MDRTDKEPSLLYRVFATDILVETIRDFVDGPFERLSQSPETWEEYKQAAIGSCFWNGYWQVWVDWWEDRPHVQRICAREYDWLLEEMYREYREDPESLHIDVAFRTLVEAGALNGTISEQLRARLLAWLQRDKDTEMYQRVLVPKRKYDE